MKNEKAALEVWVLIWTVGLEDEWQEKYGFEESNSPIMMPITLIWCAEILAYERKNERKRCTAPSCRHESTLNVASSVIYFKWVLWNPWRTNLRESWGWNGRRICSWPDTVLTRLLLILFRQGNDGSAPSSVLQQQTAPLLTNVTCRRRGRCRSAVFKRRNKSG